MRSVASLVIAFVLGASAPEAQTVAGTVQGTVRTSGTLVLSGATLTAEGVGQRRFQTISGADGQYALRLPAGAYLLRADLAGFTPVEKRVQVGPEITSEVDLTMKVFSLEEALVVLPPLEEAYRDAAAIAHVRITRTQTPEPCELSLNHAHHLAEVLSALKGDPPPSVWLDQINAGTCIQYGLLNDLQAAHTYQVGSEYLAFLYRDADGTFSPYAIVLRLEGGRIASDEHAWESIREGMTIADVIAALRALGR